LTKLKLKRKRGKRVPEKTKGGQDCPRKKIKYKKERKGRLFSNKKNTISVARDI